MEFKIDTKDIYTVVCPVAGCLDENLTAAVEKKWTELTNEGAKNLIVDLRGCESCTENIMDEMAQLHERFYNREQSLVFANISLQVKKQLQRSDYFEAVNVAPTLEEAVDIISMELLERDLLREEEDTEQ